MKEFYWHTLFKLAQLFLQHGIVHSSSNPQYSCNFTFLVQLGFIDTNAVCMVVCAFFSLKFLYYVMISSIAILASYAIVRGFSCYAGHYYYEFTIINLFKSGAIDKVDPYYWGYVGGFVLFIVAGM